VDRLASNFSRTHDGARLAQSAATLGVQVGLSLAIHLSLKWLTWWRARSRIAHSSMTLPSLSFRLAG
jgi:hypothetical protein